jgi:hypothetical protein
MQFRFVPGRSDIHFEDPLGSMKDAADGEPSRVAYVLSEPQKSRVIEENQANLKSLPID